MSEAKTVLQIKDLCVRFPMPDKSTVYGVNNVTLDLKEGEALGVVGESGCGKSVTFSSVIGLVESPPAKISGEILFDGTDLLKLPESKMQAIRGKEISMIFQEPMRSLNPVMRVGNQVAEVLMKHEHMTRAEALQRAKELFDLVEIPDSASRLNCYPHQLSGGLRQRVMIAIALACSPRILLADEPTTALDVTVQAQILSLIRQLRRDRGMSLVMITHDLGVIAGLVDRVAVFYAGFLLEVAPTADIFKKPMHPYTRGLLKCIPTLETTEKRLFTINGSLTDLTRLPYGCPFANRCPHVQARCLQELPELRPCGEHRTVRCHFAEDLAGDQQ